MRSKIYNNIRKSEFNYIAFNLEFYFSSEFYKRLFIERLDSYIDEEFNKLYSKYKVFDERFFYMIKQVLAICLYHKIEKRGFYVIDLESNSEIKG